MLKLGDHTHLELLYIASFPFPSKEHTMWLDKRDYFVLLYQTANDSTDVIDTIQEFLDSSYRGKWCRVHLDGDYAVLGFYGTRVFCKLVEPKLSTISQTISSFVGLIKSPYLESDLQHDFSKNDSFWALKLPKIEQPTNSQVKTITHFRGLKYWITGWLDRVFNLVGTSMARSEMFNHQQTLKSELHTTVELLIYCSQCQRQVIAYYEPQGKGSQIKCSIHNIYC